MVEKPTYEELEKKIQELERAEFEREGSEEALRESEKKYRLIADNATDVIWVLDAESQIFKYVSPSVDRMLGFTDKESINRSVAQMVTPTSLEYIQKTTPIRIERMLQGDTCYYTDEIEVIHKDGHIVPTEINMHFVKDQFTGLIEGTGVMRDITERKKSDEKLIESKERYKGLFMNMSSGVAIYEVKGDGEDFIFKDFNKAAEKMEKQKKEELIGRSIFEARPQVEEYGLIDVFREVWKTGKPKHHPIALYQDVNLNSWYENFVYKLPSGEIVTIFTNETERKQAEKELKISQERYQSLSKMLRLMCDNVPDMIWAKDLEKRFIFVNKAICQNLLNTDDTDEPIGKDDLFFAERERANHPNDLSWHTFGELCQDSDTITMERGIPQNFDEFGNVKGEYLFLDVHKAPFIDETGKMVGTVGSARDVTAAKEIDRKLKKLNEELEKRIKKRTSSLEDLNTALRVLLKKREEDKNQIGANIYANFKSLIQPLLNQLKNSLTMNTQEDILDILESSIKEMATPFSKKLADPIVGLTPTEIQVAALVKDGKTNKEISQLLNKSIRAVSSHRNNIRQKLGLKNKKINLRTYLLSND